MWATSLKHINASKAGSIAKLEVLIVYSLPAKELYKATELRKKLRRYNEKLDSAWHNGLRTGTMAGTTALWTAKFYRMDSFRQNS